MTTEVPKWLHVKCLDSGVWKSLNSDSPGDNTWKLINNLFHYKVRLVSLAWWTYSDDNVYTQVSIPISKIIWNKDYNTWNRKIEFLRLLYTYNVIALVKLAKCQKCYDNNVMAKSM